VKPEPVGAAAACRLFCRLPFSLSVRTRRAIKFKEDLDPELKAQLERRPSAAQALAPSEALHPLPTSGSQLLTAVPRRRTAEVLLLLS